MLLSQTQWGCVAEVMNEAGVGIRLSERWQKGVLDSAFTIGAVALASLIHFALGEQFAGRTPFLIPFLAVIISAMRGGLYQGVFATVLSLGVELSVLGEWRWFLPDPETAHFVEIVLFLIESLLISALAGSYLHGRHDSRHSQIYAQLFTDASLPTEDLIARQHYKQMNELVEVRVAERTAALAETVANLRAKLESTKTLSGLLPICGSCKRIREDDGSWSHIEDYIRAHSTAEFSHTLCPVCLANLREEIAERQRHQDEEDPPD